MEKCMILLLFLYGCVTGINASCDCEDGGFSCIDESGSVSCSTNSNCSSEKDTEFRLSNLLSQEYPYVGTNVTLKVTLTVTSITDIVVSVTNEGIIKNITGDLDNVYPYAINSVSKSDEGGYLFSATGKSENESACSAITSNIKYVFTVKIFPIDAKIVFTKGINKIMDISVYAELPGNLWKTRIQLLEDSPHTSNEVILEVTPTVDETTQIGIYKYQVATPQKAVDEGTYKFKAIEFSTTGVQNNYSVDTSFDAYVHSTLIQPDEDKYFTHPGDNVTVQLSITTDLNSYDNVTVVVIKPSGEKEDIALNQEGDDTQVDYTLLGVDDGDAGNYTFVATEYTGEFGNTTYAATIELYVWKISTTLKPKADGNYVALRNEKNSVSCSLIGPQDMIISWWQNETEVSTDDNQIVYQNDSKTVLYITENAKYGDVVEYTCRTDEAETTVGIVIEGLPESNLNRIDDSFICTSMGNPLPGIKWEIGEVSLEENSFLSTPEIEEIDRFNVKSTISIINSTLCFGDEKLKCLTSNSRGTDEEEITINSENIGIYENSYLAFSVENQTFEEAKLQCSGSLVTVKTQEKQNAVTDLADLFNVNDFYIGAHLENGAWKWIDNSNVTNVQITSGGGECAKYSYKDTHWVLESVDCSSELKYVCEIQENNTPRDLEMTAFECNATSLSVTWTAASGTTQQIVLSHNTSIVEEEQLTSGVHDKQFVNLSPGTEYLVKVYSVNELCQKGLNPYIKTTAATRGLPVAPNNAIINQNEDNSCEITWNYDGSIDDIDNFFVKVTETVIVDPDSYYNVTISEFNVTKDVQEQNINTQANTNYVAEVYAQSCAGDDMSVTPVGKCETPIAAPSHVTVPLWSPHEGNEISTAIPPADNRAGPVSCQFLVVRYIAEGDSPHVNQSTFLEIKTADAEKIEVGEEYFAYATEALSSTLQIDIGNDSQKSSCIPLPAEGSRRKRDIGNGQAFSAWNRALPFGIKIIYYLITTTPDKNKIYFANSEFSQVYLKEERPPSGNSSNATVIVLSVLAAVVVVALAVIFYLRWRKGKKSRTDRGYRFSYRKDTSYDAL
uniref:uncharacterized protein LOC120333147 n=1 Tax=Styela clava TaxID=7725 RepID=UPI00193A32D8|nr:uncharacterized protein LOC120333147 [Styela clava]